MRLFNVGFLAVVGAGLLLMGLGLCGCERADAQRSDAPPAEVRLGYFANATHAQAVLGVASGDFQAALGPQTKLSTKVFNAGPSVIEALFADEIDVAYIGPGPVLSAHERSRGRGIRVVSGAAANGVVVVARAGSGIETLADLKGRRLATPQHGNTQDVAARHYLQSVLRQQDLSNVLPIPNAEQASMMQRGQIDAAWVPEPWGQRLIQEAGAVLIAEEKDLWPEQQFVLTVVATTPEFLEAHPEVIARLLGVHRAWTRRLQDDPQAYVERLGEALFALTGKRLPDGVLPAALGRVTFIDDPRPDDFRTMAGWAHQLGFSQRPPNLAGLIVATPQATPEEDHRP